jgi:hypothetical protein
MKTLEEFYEQYLYRGADETVTSKFWLAIKKVTLIKEKCNGNCRNTLSLPRKKELKYWDLNRMEVQPQPRINFWKTLSLQQASRSKSGRGRRSRLLQFSRGKTEQQFSKSNNTRCSLYRLIGLPSTWCRAAAFFSASGAALSQEVPMVKWMSNQPALWTPGIYMWLWLVLCYDTSHTHSIKAYDAMFVISNVL